VNDVGSLAIEVVFGVVFLATLATYLRRRDPLSRDVMLVFASLVIVFATGIVGDAFGEESPVTIAFGALGGVLLFAQPLLVLRICVRTGDVTSRAWWLALAALALSLIPLFAVTPRQPWSPLPLVAVFSAIEGVAAWMLARNGLQRIGYARFRLITAALGTTLFGLTLLGAGVVLQSQALSAVGDVALRALALLAGLAYAIAFLPIGPVRQVWLAAAAFRFTEQLNGEAGGSPDDPWRNLAEAARRVTGATHAAVVLGEATEERAVLVGDARDAAAHALVEQDVRDELADAIRNAHERARAAWPKTAVVLGVTSKHAVLSALVLDARPTGTATLLWVTPRRSLFAADDRELLEILGRRASAFAERAAMLSAQASLSERLAATNVALEGASRAKSDFLAAMSHELRTPLSAIIGFSSLMRDEPGDEERVSVPREWVEHVNASGEHLLSLINDVLDLSKVEAGRLGLELTPVALGPAIAELVGGMRPVASGKGVRLDADPTDAEIVVDRGRLRQMLYNLVSNAIKFTPDGGSVRVSVAAGADETRISVADTGVGIAPEDQERVFREFQQLGDAATRQEGTGLGLAVTRRLAEAHGGRIELASAPGSGSRFTITLPARNGADSAPPAPFTHTGNGRVPDASAAVATAGAGDLLVIEDDPSAVRLLRAYIEDGEHRLRVCRDGESGLAEARRSTPAAIILDVLLPGTDGWDVLRELKGDPVLRDVPVIVVTVVDERELGLALGAVDYFLKPVDRDALLARLARYAFTTKVQQRPVKILVVDDEPSARSMVEAALTPVGFDVVQAASGAEAIDYVRGDHVDLVICDLVMPDLDGFEVVARLQRDARTRDVPILILTGHDLTAADKARLNGHILGVVSKGGDDVRQELHRWLTRALRTAEATAT
jgi:signal transduction histidine kinase/CheY-like chemotaxis protein